MCEMFCVRENERREKRFGDVGRAENGQRLCVCMWVDAMLMRETGQRKSLRAG
jgi:hypothetical protein